MFVGADDRWITCIHNDGARLEGSFDNRSYGSVYCNLDLEWRDSVRLLVLDLYFPHQERRISFQTFPLGRLLEGNRTAANEGSLGNAYILGS